MMEAVRLPKEITDLVQSTLAIKACDIKDRRAFMGEMQIRIWTKKKIYGWEYAQLTFIKNEN